MTRLPAGDPAFDYREHSRDNLSLPDHVVRLNVTAGLIASLGPLETVCDPACGDGTILDAAYRLRPFGRATLGDVSRPNLARLRPAYPVEIVEADLSETLRSGFWDLVLLTEILEHVEDPLAVLRLARSAARYLVASSPEDEQPHDCPTHVWAFSRKGYLDLLTDAGWEVTAEVLLDPRSAYRWRLVVAR